MASPHDALRDSLTDALALERPGGAPLARPLRDAFHLPAAEASVPAARRLVTDRLREWHVDQPSREDAQLLVSELFTNAVRHTDSERVSCELWVIGVRLRLEVTDQGGGGEPDAPEGAEEDTDGEGGRGLLLVSVLADEWGIRPEGEEGEGDKGHAVWAELPCTRTLV
ncbi:ATP-binding protein [Streptomyces sp. ODS28]|uniref:ATP-binding protein n=1 Tax=Streptomyces sp. ODS28 TaxID=3136688 RepID=UPI0031F0E1D0